MKNRAPNNLDHELLSFDPKYPIGGTYLQKYNFVSTQMNRLEKDFHPFDLHAIHTEEKELLDRARAGG